MGNIKYSFIIPHHNCPELLLRLIKSIPYREDIEIIVVDDNSNAKPYNLPTYCKIIEICKADTKGAGKARNLGLESAKGEWLLFPDSDDYYHTGFISYLDELTKNDSLEMIFFGIFFNYDVEKGKELSQNAYNKSISDYSRNPKKSLLKNIKHGIQTPWNFALNRKLLSRIHVKFEEVPVGNDFFFHHKVAMAANNVAVIPEKLYYWVFNKNSITNKTRTKDELMKYVKERGHMSIMLKVEAEAWDTIDYLHILFLRDTLKKGLVFAFKHLLVLLKGDIPWTRIYWHKMFKLNK